MWMNAVQVVSKRNSIPVTCSCAVMQLLCRFIMFIIKVNCTAKFQFDHSQLFR